MPDERQPTLPALETLVPPELLNPAKEVAPQGMTPAQRVDAAGAYSPTGPAESVPSGTATPAPPATPATPPVAPTTPFGTAAPPPAPPPDGLRP
jgi:hypothetical protein